MSLRKNLWGLRPQAPRAARAALLAGALLLGTALVPSPAGGTEIRFIHFGAPVLLVGSATGVAMDGDTLVLTADAPSSEDYFPHPQFGIAESAPRELGGPLMIRGLRVNADIPTGGDVRVEARGRVHGRWTEWQTPFTLGALDGATALQMRVTLLADPEQGASPRLRAISGESQPLVVPVQVSPPARPRFGPPTATLWATREGLVGQTTANGHVIQERDRFVALPSWRVLNSRGRHDYVVRVEYRGRSVEAPVWDIGPWNIEDNYWDEQRDRFPDLPRWKCQADAAFFEDYQGGRDGFGRYITIPTCIDLSDGIFWDDLGMTANDWVKVTFLWLDAPSPPVRATPLVTPRTPPPEPEIVVPPLPLPSGPSMPVAGASRLVATPNPVLATPSGVGKTTINWDTGDGSVGQVYVSADGGPQVLFSEGSKGSRDAPWIQRVWTYEFRLYQGTTREVLLTTVKVTTR